MNLSPVGQRLAHKSGILELMDDLGNALASDPSMRMLGGGNPAAIPAVQKIWRDRIGALLTEDGGSGLDRALGTYDPPAGNPRFRQALAALLQREYAWEIAPKQT
ncbi:hypothetical protein OAF27_02760 [Verrucomicrobiales bacterium]|nr:hypothetical protein [Verrucomicrobiales bacterium]